MADLSKRRCQEGELNNSRSRSGERLHSNGTDPRPLATGCTLGSMVRLIRTCVTSSGGPGKEVASVTVLGTLSQVGCHGCDGGEHLGRDLVPLLRLDVAVSKYSITQVITG